MTSPDFRWYRVTAKAQGQQYTLDTKDPAKIGPWLVDIVDSIMAHAGRGYVPVEIQVMIQ